MRSGIVYCRESRDDGGEKYERIETQRDILLRFCKENGIKPVHIILDDNESGGNFLRLQKVRRWIEKEKIDVFVAKDASRIGRNQLESLEFIRFLELNRVELLFESERYDETLFGLFAWLNERRAREDGEKIRRVLRHKMEEGSLLIKPPYGYRIVDKKLVIHQEEAEKVQRVFDFYLHGFGMTEIADRLCRQAPGEKWSCQKVSRILHNPAYCGVYQVGKTKSLGYARKRVRCESVHELVCIENHHPAIITDEKFSDTAELLHRNRRVCEHKYSGILFCRDCSSPMTRRIRGDAGAYFVCSLYNRNGKRACDSHKIYESKLDEVISSALLELFRERDGLWQAKESCLSVHRQNELKKQLKRLELQLERLYDDSRIEGFPQFLFEKKLGEYNRQRESILEELSQGGGTSVAAPSEITITRELLHILADRIDIHSDGTCSVYKK